ncbi:MAG: hypothetical protein HZA92_14295 [Verrucomicrobia bacterium]|nr:hypothetical protein [Verrucomicrobiota bacterium]
MFFSLVVVSLVAGNTFDLVGTFVYQPDFQHEANFIYVFLKRHGYSPGWPEVIAAKLGVCVIFVIGLHQFLRRRRDYYCPSPVTFREFITQFFYGRPMTWFQTFYSIPRFLPTLLCCAVVCSLGGPYYAYCGYDNLAAEYGWRILGGFWVGWLWIDYAVWNWALLAFAWLCWEMWRDYQDDFPGDAGSNKGEEPRTLVD